jgi:hypothetical protein
MVSSIVPGATSANVLGVDTRFSRGAQQAPRREESGQGDRVELSGAAIAQARESVRAGMAQVQEALALGSESQAMLVKAQAAARTGSQADLDATLSAYGQRVDAAIARGARVVSGEDVSVQAEPGAAGVTIPGVDLRLKAQPGAADIIGIAADARADDPALAANAQRSLDTLQTAMSKLVDSARALEAHQGFLGAAEAAGVRPDLDAEGARLLALQVRQGLEAAKQPIANVEPQAVLALFRA